jgi:hypothetical protein
MVQVELEVVLPQDMFHLRIGAKQHLAAGAHRAVVNVPSNLCTMLGSGAQVIPRRAFLMAHRAVQAASTLELLSSKLVTRDNVREDKGWISERTQ